MIDFLTVKVWLWIACGLLLLNVWQAVFMALKDAALTEAHAALTVAKSERDQARTLAGSWQSSAAVCSEHTARLETEGAANKAQALQAIAKAHAEAAKYRPAFLRIEALKAAPTPSGAGCTQAIKELRK